MLASLLTQTPSGLESAPNNVDWIHRIVLIMIIQYEKIHLWPEVGLLAVKE